MDTLRDTLRDTPADTGGAPLTMDCPIPFGRFREMPVWLVIREDPAGLWSLIDDLGSDVIQLDNEAYETLKNRLRK